MKLYLAGPMRGYPEFNFPAFAEAAFGLRFLGHDVFSPAEKGEEVELTNAPDLQDDEAFRRKVFKIDTAYICDEAEGIALLDGWENSSGCRAEVALARAIGIPVYKIVYYVPGISLRKIDNDLRVV